MDQIAIIWLIFGFLFLALAIFHFYQSSKKINKIEIAERPLSGMVKIDIGGSDIDQPAKDLNKHLNTYIADMNSSNKWMNIVAGIGYILASATAFFSIYLSIIS